MNTCPEFFNAPILIVDDQDAIVLLLEEMLRRAGYVCISSTKNPHEVCALHRLHRYSLIILDLQMPGMDGFQVMEGLKAIETSDYLPVMVQTGEPVQKLRALQNGAGDFVSKPLDLAEIVLRVHNLLKMRQLHLDAEIRTKVAEESAQTLRTALQKVRDLNREIQNFYHTLSHELKTPLTSASEFVSIVMDGLAGPLNEPQMEYLGIAKESCDQLRRYINDLLDVTRLETGKMSIEFQMLSLAPLVERVVKMLSPAAAGKGLRLSCDCDANLPAVLVDRQRILQVLTNLTVNAIKFTAAGGHVRLSLSEAPFTLLAKPCPPAQFVETIKDMCGVPPDRFRIGIGKSARMAP